MSGFTGNGVFARFHNWVSDLSAGFKISYNRNDAEDSGIASGLSSVLCKDGQQTTTAPVPFALGYRVSDGSAATPSIGFINDTDSGIYRIGANNLGFAAGGTKVLDFATATISSAVTLSLGIPLTVAQGGTGVTTSDSVRLSRSEAEEIPYLTLATNTSRQISFDTVDHDTNDMAATATTAAITINTTGTYLIVFDVMCRVESEVSITASFAKLEEEGSTTLASLTISAAEDDTNINVPCIVQLTEGDTIRATIQAISTPSGKGVFVFRPTLAAVRLSA